MHEAIGHGGQGLKHNELASQRGRQQAAGAVPTQGAQPGGQQANGQHQPRVGPGARTPRRIAGPGAGHQHVGRHAHQRHWQGGQALGGGPGARAHLRVGLHPGGVADGIPGPANQSRRGQRHAPTQTAGARRASTQTLPLRAMHTGNSGGNQQQGQSQAPPSHIVPRQVGTHRDDHWQGADDHGWQRYPGQLYGPGQRQVIQHIADSGQLQRFNPVGSAQARQCSAIAPGQRQSNHAKSKIAPKCEHGWRIVGQQDGRDKYQSPSQTSSQGKGDTGGHAKFSNFVTHGCMRQSGG